MLGAMGYTGSGWVPRPGSIVLALFVIVVLGLVLSMLYDAIRRRFK